jgi:hypothetical protein
LDHANAWKLARSLSAKQGNPKLSGLPFAGMQWQSAFRAEKAAIKTALTADISFSVAPSARFA